MQYFVTGATGFIGRRLVKTLLARRGSTVHFLLRQESAAKLPELLAYWGVSKARALPVYGDLTGKKLLAHLDHGEDGFLELWLQGRLLGQPL